MLIDSAAILILALRSAKLKAPRLPIPSRTNIDFDSVTYSVTIRLYLEASCKSKGIKLFGLLAAAAGFIAAHASKNLPAENWEKYSLATLIDCCSVLDPVLSDHHVGSRCKASVFL
nr:alcohol acetyltransferase [Tanacetum cinerariifolium]